MTTRPPHIVYRVCLLLTLCAQAQEALPQDVDTLSRGLFTVEYTPRFRPVAERTLDILDAAVAEFAPLLPAGDAPIRVLVVDAPEEFERHAVHFTGLNVSGLARPGSDLIIVKAPRLRPPGSDYPGTLRHELVHLLLYRNVNPAYLPQWLNEGLAMSLANEFRWQSMFTVSRMFLQNSIIPYHRLDHAFRAPSGQTQFGEAYAQALSMTRFLRDHLGEAQFWEVVHALSDQPFEDALRVKASITVRRFWELYERSLWKYVIVATLASGFFLQPAAVLLVLGYWRRRRIAQALYRRWEEEDAAAASGEPIPFRWEEVAEDPDAWKDGYSDDDESW